MNEKPEALRLAHELDAYHNAPHHKLAAIELRCQHYELRRLHAENERLRDELKEDAGVIAVWRGRTERAESENERLRELLTEAKDLAWSFGADSLFDRISDALNQDSQRVE